MSEITPYIVSSKLKIHTLMNHHHFVALFTCVVSHCNFHHLENWTHCIVGFFEGSSVRAVYTIFIPLCEFLRALCRA